MAKTVAERQTKAPGPLRVSVCVRLPVVRVVFSLLSHNSRCPWQRPEASFMHDCIDLTWEVCEDIL